MNEMTLAWTGPGLLDVAEVRRPDGDLLALDEAGGISCIDLQSMAITRLGTVTLSAPFIENPGVFWMTPRWRLHASPDGAFAAVVFDGGRHGVVLDLGSGRCEVTMQLDGGDYHEETVPFSVCFASANGKTVLVHRTSWNRLDASDPASGELLTERGPTRYENDQPPPHYLDYFHGRLLVDPSGTRLFDAGWVWQPVAVPRIFDLLAWLGSNVWESEDGPSAKWLNLRDDWNFPACWIDGNRIAWGGVGDWDEEEFETAAAGPGVRIVDLRRESSAHDRKILMSAEPLELFTDGRLLFAAHEGSTSVWVLETGESLKERKGFVATHYHLRLGQLIETRPHHIRKVATNSV